MDRQICKITDKQANVKPGRDRIGTMFFLQEKFMEKIGIKIKSMSQGEREKLIKECCLASIAENIELLDETNWKPWKKTKKEIDLEQARFEVVDDLCFLIEKALALGMDAEMLFQYHSRKIEINHERQNNGY